MRVAKIILRLLIVIAVCLPVLGRSTIAPANPSEHIRSFTRSIEFDYVSWIGDALWLKLSQTALGVNRYLSAQKQHEIVLEYLSLVQKLAQTEGQIAVVYGDPEVIDHDQATLDLRRNLQTYNTRMREIGAIAETILQSQIGNVAASEGLTLGGQPIPPVWFHSTPLPLALIISPRNSIQSDEDISLLPDLSLDQVVSLEDRVSKAENVSALVVPVGGIGVYPTMVMRTPDLDWLAETISHEWTHNYLTLRPLGVNYESSPEMRTMNETTASIAGKELGKEVIQRYYPELIPSPTPPSAPSGSAAAAEPAKPAAPVFDFQAEMHSTRVVVDQMLSQGKIDNAEAYMNERRNFFWDHGYLIRKLNQAYFAFYGAYADVPGGAAGEDPVGPAVRALRGKSGSLAAFLNKIAWMTSFSELKASIQ